ncbi:MAG: hypothetical protein DWQ34_16190 [Planctomycetota bacterium]|nr:MAG: hypothetical protein DWQ29_12180 [Planctomycetota bacterium]REJ90933.1 MAG: hypothetical protein DWQ34_16190 [Planctomycetota bacterium]REK20873.1 MAG: hypothetical protein DWQ41_23495 [Planctomycetota bacterium]REK32783.1 MAG: hypothetical protein DWQ45_16360 [Planctomycetota bacterium]
MHYPEGWPEPPGLVEKIGRWIPVVGWIVAAALEYRRLKRPAWDFIDAQMDQRTHVPDSAWDDDEMRIEAANVVVDACVEAIGWDRPYFIPEDPFEIMIELRTGDCCELDAVFRIERAFETRLMHSENDTTRWITEGTTFGEIVDQLIANSPKYAPRYPSSTT